MNYFKDCIDCKDRAAGCHSTCDKYKVNKERQLADKAKADALKNKNNEYESYIRSGVGSHSKWCKK